LSQNKGIESSSFIHSLYFIKSGLQFFFVFLWYW